MSKITVTTIAGATSGSDANKVKIESGDELDVVNGDLTVDTSTLKVDSSNNNVGIGETSPLGKLHIKSGDSAASSVNGNANELVVENSDYTGITVLGENETSIMFGDNEDPDVGRIVYFHGTDTMSFMTNANNAMHIDSAGRVTKPNQPAFSARGTYSSVNINAEVWAFNSTSYGNAFNIGGHYNTSDGKFTAPVAGRYFFHFSTIINTQGTNLTIQLRINNNVADQIHMSQDEGGWNTYSVSNIYNLSANDYVTVYVAGNYQLYGISWSRFTGHLIG